VNVCKCGDACENINLGLWRITRIRRIYIFANDEKIIILIKIMGGMPIPVDSPERVELIIMIIHTMYIVHGRGYNIYTDYRDKSVNNNNNLSIKCVVKIL